MTDRHVVLAKPGDVLLIGNVGPIDAEMLDALTAFFAEARIRVAIFEEDMELDALTEERK